MPRELTEQEWLTCSHPKVLLHYAPELSQRKLRLFSIACAHQVWDLLSFSTRQLLQLAEQFIDEGVSRDELSTSYHAIQPKQTYYIPHSNKQRAKIATTVALLAAQPAELQQRSLRVWEMVAYAQDHDQWESYSLENPIVARLFGQQCEMLRDIIGNPYRPVELQPQWLSWDQGTIVKMAQVIYDKRAHEDLPFLGDALEEAGCTDDTILEHCRQQQGHCHGCWALDLILQKT